MSKMKTNEELDAALAMLDTMLEEHIEVRAIGGYALAHHGIRDSSILTEDIDTVTPTYPRSVQRAISQVASKLDLVPDWLNNDAVYAPDGDANEEDVAYHDEMLQAVYVPHPTLSFEHIDMCVADVETLANAKGFACDMLTAARGVKDVRDLVAIADHEGCKTFDELTKKFPLLQDFNLSAVREAMAPPKTPIATKTHSQSSTETSFSF